MLIQTTDSTDHLVDDVLRKLETSRTASTTSFSSASSSTVYTHTENSEGDHNDDKKNKFNVINSFYRTLEHTGALFKKEKQEEVPLPGVLDLLAASVDEDEGAAKASGGSDANSNRAETCAEVKPAVQHDTTRPSCDGKDGVFSKEEEDPAGMFSCCADTTENTIIVLPKTESLDEDEIENEKLDLTRPSCDGKDGVFSKEEEDPAGSSCFLSMFSCCADTTENTIIILPKTESLEEDEIENEKHDLKDDLLLLEGNFRKIAVLQWHLAESKATRLEYYADGAEDDDAMAKKRRAELELEKTLLESMRVMESMAPTRECSSSVARSATYSGSFSDDDEDYDDATVETRLVFDANHPAPSDRGCCFC